MWRVLGFRAGGHVLPAHGVFQLCWVYVSGTCSLNRRCSPAGALLGDGVEAAVGAAGQHVQPRHGARQQQGGVGAAPVAEVAADGAEVRIFRGGLLHPGNGSRFTLEGLLGIRSVRCHQEHGATVRRNGMCPSYSGTVSKSR